MGFLNFHPGTLPAYRGPDPIFWQLRNGEPAGAVTVHRMEADFDAGPVLHVEPIPIEPHDTYGIHLTHLADATRLATVALAEQLDAGAPLAATPQIPTEAAFHPVPSLRDLIVDWPNAPARTVVDLCRAANPNRGGALTFFRGTPIRLLQATDADVDHPPRLPAGTVVSTNSGDPLQVLAADGRYLRLELIQMEEGYYTGARFASLFNVRIGEKFTTPSLS
jgi:methionyl-tRNA formyltransferase